MKTGQRIRLKQKIARTLSEQPWADVDLVLEEHGLPTTGPGWNNQSLYEYVLAALSEASTQGLVELDAYLHSSTEASPNDAPWKTADLRLFLGHVAARWEYAVQLKAELAAFGIEGFVAHTDIEPNKKWQRVIEAALRSCDALAALLHDGFRESSWCDQEVGFVLGRNALVLTVSYDLHGYGFLGELQSLHAGRSGPDKVAALVARVLLGDARTGATLTSRMVEAFAAARTRDQADTLAEMLATKAPRISDAQLTTMQKAQRHNPNVADARQVEAHLTRIEARFGLSDPPAETLP